MALIFGKGSHGRDIEEIVKRSRHVTVWREFGVKYYDEDPEKGCPMIPPGPCYVGVNWPEKRRGLVYRLDLRGASALIDPTADVGTNCEFGEGVVVAPQTLMLCDVTLGAHVHVNYGCSMTRCSIGAFSTIAPGVVICGDVEIGEGVLIGCGAVIRNLVRIGDNATVGTGAVVINDVAAGQTVVGVPAKPWEGR